MTIGNILISGSSRGLGKELTEHFLEKGFAVYGCSRSACDINHDNYHHAELDIGSADEVVAFFYGLRKKIKHLDAVINNAGIASMNAFALTPVETYQKIFNVNVQGTFLFCQKALTLLKKAAHPRTRLQIW